MRRVCPQRAAAPGAVRHEAAPIRSPAVSAERLHRSASSWQRFALCFAERLASVRLRAAVLRIDRGVTHWPLPYVRLIHFSWLKMGPRGGPARGID